MFMLIATYAQIFDFQINIIYRVTELLICRFFKINRVKSVILQISKSLNLLRCYPHHQSVYIFRDMYLAAQTAVWPHMECLIEHIQLCIALLM